MKVSLVPAAAVMGFALAGAAHAQTATQIDPQWYVRADGGVSFQSKLNGDPKVKGDTGWTADVAVGHQFDDNFRAEAELLYSDADHKNSDGKIKVLAGLANAYYDFNTGTKFRPYIGAGVGIGQVKLDDGPVDDDDTGFAYQLMTGVSYPINDKLSAQVGYRYLGVTEVEVGSGPRAIQGDYHDEAVTVGVTYKFGS